MGTSQLIQLPPEVQAPFSWVRLYGDRAYVSGQAPLNPDSTLAAPFGRVGAELSAEQGYQAARLATLSRNLETQYPDTNAGIAADLSPLREVWSGESRAGIQLVLGACAFLLLIACSNVATLLLVWAADRERDMAVRMALSAPPARLIAIQLTGMGDDGADAMVELKRRGGRTIAEAESTAMVFGIPRCLIERGGATKVLPAHDIAQHLLAWIDGTGA